MPRRTGRGLPLCMRESELLAHIYERSRGMSGAGSGVVVGPGDDCAVVRAGSEVLLLKVDQVVSGVHFRADAPLALVARKAMARAVSDVAAMAGTPRWSLAGAVLPRGYPQERADELFDAMKRWADEWACPLVGGDISQAAGDALSLSVTIVGAAHPSRGPVLRSGARPGDAVCVTGALGGSMDAATGLGRHLTFEPRLREARFLAETLEERLGAMMDISDGLGVDGARLAAASGVRIELEAARLPLAAGVAGWRAACADGEDYELLFTARGEVPPRCEETGTVITAVGVVCEGSGCVLRDGADVFDAGGLGWEHRSGVGERG